MRYKQRRVVEYQSVPRHRPTTLPGYSNGSLGRRIVVEDNLPVLIAIVAPGLLFILGGLGALSLNTAYTPAIAFSLTALFGLRLYEGRTASMSWPHSLISGAAAGAIGLIVFAFEVFFG